MHAYLIDPEARTVTLVDYTDNEESFEQLYSLLKCDTVDVVYLDDRGTVAFVDDNGLLNNPQHFWRWTPFGADAQSFAGRALILGTELHGDEETNGSTISVDTTAYPLDLIKAMVKFAHRSELTPEQYAPFMHFISLN